MGTFIAVFVVLMLVVIGMGIGVIFGRPPLKGSCGGLNNVGVERACGCTDVCANEAQQDGGKPSSASVDHGVKHYKP
ncbi:MAG: (Na+)-NQR maturation NqrM [Cardiobacteriaceae bacterium]|nr:(Na+)-NQR maturation NqrM [Cardiobacteriaceae bacterium]